MIQLLYVKRVYHLWSSYYMSKECIIYGPITVCQQSVSSLVQLLYVKRIYHL